MLAEPVTAASRSTAWFLRRSRSRSRSTGCRRRRRCPADLAMQAQQSMALRALWWLTKLLADEIRKQTPYHDKSASAHRETNVIGRGNQQSWVDMGDTIISRRLVTATRRNSLQIKPGGITTKLNFDTGSGQDQHKRTAGLGVEGVVVFHAQTSCAGTALAAAVTRRPFWTCVCNTPAFHSLSVIVPCQLQNRSSLHVTDEACSGISACAGGRRGVVSLTAEVHPQCEVRAADAGAALAFTEAGAAQRTCSQ